MKVTIAARVTFDVADKFEALLAGENTVVHLEATSLLDLVAVAEVGGQQRTILLTENGEEGTCEDGEVTIEIRGALFTQNRLAQALADRQK